MDVLLLRRQVAELFIVRASGHSYDNQRLYPELELTNKDLEKLIKEGVGGVIFFGGSVNEVKDKSALCKTWASKPLLFCADVEEGLGQRFHGGSSFIPPLGVAQIFKSNPKLGIEIAHEYGLLIGEQARKCGLNWVLAPVCDINSNPLNPVINLRAWGEDSQTVSLLVSAFQRGIASQGVLTCAKHFPGHGDSDVDSHLELPTLGHDLSRLKRSELLPFQAMIAEGVNSLMTGHLLLKQIDSKFPATLSKKILTTLLRQDLGFDGLIVTDALVMQAISNFYGAAESAVLAFDAGADLLMMPKEPWKAIDALVEAIVSNRIPVKRLYESLERRNRELKKVQDALCLDLNNDQAHFNEEFTSDKAELFGEKLVRHFTIIRQGSFRRINRNVINLLKVDSIYYGEGLPKSAPALVIPEGLGFRNLVCHPCGITPWVEDEQEVPYMKILRDRFIFFQLFIRGKPFRGSQKSDSIWFKAINKFQEINKLAGVVVYGCPYFADKLFNSLEVNIPFAYSPAQLPEAQRYVLESLLHSLPKNDYKNINLSNQFTD